MEQKNQKKEIEEAIYKQAYATAKALLSSRENGISKISGKTQMEIEGLRSSIEISIEFYE